MLSAIKRELFLRKDELQQNKIASLYLGGGTPSLLEVEELKELIDEVLKYFQFENDIEITLEANPDDLDKNFLKKLSESYVNRLSIGTQSFHEPDLVLMNRAHSAQEAESSIKRAQDYGFENISIDLIYGAPSSGFEIWKENLQKTVELKVPHVSSYALTVEPKTALNQWILTNKIKAPEESLQNDEFYYMSRFLKENGFQHYEISNFALPGFHSRHNSAYWRYKEYLGLGPSAHSYNGSTRSWNVANNMLYLKGLADGLLPRESEQLSLKDRYNEMLMIGLRTIWGVNLSRLRETLGEDFLADLLKSAAGKMEEGILYIDDNHLKIPEQHWFMADGIAADLFLTD